MKKLELFKTMGESLARVTQYNNDQYLAKAYFRDMAEQMYPFNERRREWAESNLMMFYTQEIERLIIMRKLKGTADRSHNILEMIRQRKALES